MALARASPWRTPRRSSEPTSGQTVRAMTEPEQDWDDERSDLAKAERCEEDEHEATGAAPTDRRIRSNHRAPAAPHCSDQPTSSRPPGPGRPRGERRRRRSPPLESGQCAGSAFASLGRAASTACSRYASAEARSAEHDRPDPDQPHERDQSRAREDDEQRAEHDRRHAAECHRELAFEFASEGDGCDDLERAHRDRPEGHEVEQRQGRQARPREGDDAGDDAEDAHDRRRPRHDAARPGRHERAR